VNPFLFQKWNKRTACCPFFLLSSRGTSVSERRTRIDKTLSLGASVSVAV